MPPWTCGERTQWIPLSLFICAKKANRHRVFRNNSPKIVCPFSHSVRPQWVLFSKTKFYSRNSKIRPFPKNSSNPVRPSSVCGQSVCRPFRTFARPFSERNCRPFSVVYPPSSKNKKAISIVQSFKINFRRPALRDRFRGAENAENANFENAENAGKCPWTGSRFVL